MPAAVLFDLDGTLVDSLQDIAGALNDVLAAAGHPTHSVPAVASMVGDGAAALVQRAAPPEADLTGLLQALKLRYGAAMVATTRPFPGVLPLVAELGARNVPLAVLSNKPHAMTVAVVDALFAAGSFVTVLGQREGVPKKPDPTAALAIADALSVAPERCAMVGDTSVDVRTGRRAGMESIAVTWGF
ncbi:MAG: HAD-IA family hydrolase, partial [Myxococcota bacterium]